jgi:hypothetical protein
MPTLVHEFDYNAPLPLIKDVGRSPISHRIVVTAAGGECAGDRLKGTFVGAGGDWLWIGTDGFGRLDVRITLETVDGAIVLFQYLGIIELTPEITALLGGGKGSTEFGAQYFFTHPRLETSDERYAWVNTSMFVGQGRIVEGPAVEYRVFRVEND